MSRTSRSNLSGNQLGNNTIQGDSGGGRLLDAGPDRATKCVITGVLLLVACRLVVGRRCLARLVMGCPGVLEQTRRPTLLVAAQPFAHGADGGSEPARGGLDAALPGRFDQPEAMVVRVFHLTHQNEIGDQGGDILAAARPPAPPPSAGGEFHPPLRTDALQLHQGDTM